MTPATLRDVRLRAAVLGELPWAEDFVDLAEVLEDACRLTEADSTDDLQTAIESLREERDDARQECSEEQTGREAAEARIVEVIALAKEYMSSDKWILYFEALDEDTKHVVKHLNKAERKTRR